MTTPTPAEVWNSTPPTKQPRSAWHTLTVIAQCGLLALGALAFVLGPADLFFALALLSIAVSAARTALR